MSDIKIDKRVPIPPRKMPNVAKYPWRELEVGESFVVAITTTVKSRMNGFSSAAERYGIKVTCRTMAENGIKVIRVWRIE